MHHTEPHTQRNNNRTSGGRSVLATLRALIPDRPLNFTETLLITERQATKLLELHQATTAPVPNEIITELPRIKVVLDHNMPVSGSSGWDGHNWVISLSVNESWTRRRFTLAHEYLHIIHHGRSDQLYSTNPALAALQAEQAADYFAGCLLIPKRLLKSAWGNGLQTPKALARYFSVSEAAIRVRLAQTGLVIQSPRCTTRPRRAQTRYHDQPAFDGGRESR